MRAGGPHRGPRLRRRALLATIRRGGIALCAAVVAQTAVPPCGPGHAEAATVTRDVCVHDAARVDLAPDAIVIGCRVRDCCSRCAADADIDVRIDLEGDAFARVTMRIEAAGERAGSMRIEGPAAGSPPAAVEIGAGTTWLRGASRLSDERPPRLRLAMHVDARELRLAAAAAAAPAASAAEKPHSAGPMAEAAAAPAPSAAASQEPAPATKPAAPPAPATRPTPEAHEEGEPQWEGQAARPPGFTIPARLRLTVTQMAGEVTLARDRYELRLQPCPVQRPRTDRILLAGNDGDDEAVVLLHGRRDDGCTGGELWRSRDAIYAGNLLAADGCPSEIAVLSHDDAVVLQNIGPLPATSAGGSRRDEGAGRRAGPTPVAMSVAPPTSPSVSIAETGWTSAVGERLELRLDGPPVPLPLRIAIAAEEPERTDVARRVHLELAVADMLLNQSGCGLTTLADARVVELPIDESTASSWKEAAVAASGGDCAALAQAMTEAGLSGTGVVVILYLPRWPAGAVACTAEAVVVVGAAAQPESLAHGLGHLLGLEHAPALPAHNLMQAHVAFRRALTEGQCFRASLGPRSVVNRWKLRAGPIRSCDQPTSRACPSIGWTDLLRSGLPAQEDLDDADVVLSWLECEDCSSELERMIQNETGVIPMLAASLRDGPAPARRDALRHHLAGLFLRLQSYAATHAAARTEQPLQSLFETYLNAFDLLVRARAAQALGAMEAPAARDALSKGVVDQRAEDEDAAPWRRLFRRR
ncbi:MAG TPA: hypothetical protein VEC57_08295 [Candidatus Limnocylindrales bacterium]|nr:hypothetical protein [Candidatus Limnocylindrales bacterium]